MEDYLSQQKNVSLCRNLDDYIYYKDKIDELRS
jgi:hypothetical protein